MPNILALVDKVTKTRHEGLGLIEVDEKLCAHLGVPVDDVNFYKGWVDWMGLYVNDDWAGVQEGYKNSPDKKPILDWLEANYDLNTYAIIGRR